jgi:ADP-heptose:LPS heptosyltransferase
MRNILIIKTSSFGDIVQALPVAARLREALPGGRISWLVNTQYRRLLEENRCVDRIIPFPRHLWKPSGTLVRAAASFVSLCRGLYGGGFDAVLDLQGLLRSAVFTAATVSPVRAGFADAREGAPLLYNVRVRVPHPEVHAVERYLLVPAALGLPGSRVSFPLGTGEAHRDWAQRLLDRLPPGGRAPRVGLSVTARWKSKRWPPASFAALGDAAVSSGAAVVAIGAAEHEGGETVRMMKGPALAVDGVWDPLRLAALHHRLDLLETNDTGPMHQAAADGTPVVAQFGPTSFRRTGPSGPAHRIVCASVPSSPSYRRECDRGEGCMAAIPVERVWGEVEQVLRERRGADHAL